jgi:hypothetical protein
MEDDLKKIKMEATSKKMDNDIIFVVVEKLE